MHVQKPSPDNDFQAEHIKVLNNSFRHLLGKSMTSEALSEKSFAEAIFFAPFAVVSHNTNQNPIFNYANDTALELFEMTWEEFICLPSQQSAELPNREERARLLATVGSQGFIENYSGIRISKNGQRFMINQATVWNLYDAGDQYYGQAAIFSHWDYL